MTKTIRVTASLQQGTSVRSRLVDMYLDMNCQEVQAKIHKDNTCKMFGQKMRKTTWYLLSSIYNKTEAHES